MGEGAGIVVLEELEHARARGAKILAEVVGYGNTCDGYHITSPDPELRGITRAIVEAMEGTGLDAAEGLYINAHGTSTKLNDASETRGFKLALGEEAARAAHISSTKSMTGHMLGATGAVEAIACARRAHRGNHPSHDPLRRGRPRVRPRLHPQPGRFGTGALGALHEPRVRRAQRGSGVQSIRGLTMHIDSKKLNEVAALMEDHGLTRVRLSEEDGRVVELERMTAPAPEAIAVPVAAPMTAAVTPRLPPLPQRSPRQPGACTCCRNRTGPYRR